MKAGEVITHLHPEGRVALEGGVDSHLVAVRARARARARVRVRIRVRARVRVRVRVRVRGG